MDIDEYLRQKRTLEGKKEMLEAKEKLDKEKAKIEKKKAYPDPREPRRVERSSSGSGESSTMKTWMIINAVFLFAVILLLATFYLFPRFEESQIKEIIKEEVGENKLTGHVVKNVNKQSGAENKTKEENKTNKTGSGTIYLGPDFKLSIRDITEGLFDDKGKLENSGEILSIKDTTFYNDFELTLENKEDQKILCFIDRKMDLDLDIDGKFDKEGIYSLDRHKLKMTPMATEKIKAGIESVPGNVDGYEGKGEIWVEYESRCYFCTDLKCDSYEEKGEGTERAFFRVRINEHLTIPDGNKTNKTS